MEAVGFAMSTRRATAQNLFIGFTPYRVRAATAVLGDLHHLEDLAREIGDVEVSRPVERNIEGVPPERKSL